MGHHAMVMVGARRDAASGQLFFLLQNWWPRKQFVEVDAAYLSACRALVYFVATPQPHMPAALPTLEGRWFETEMLDKPEALCCDAAAGDSAR